MSINIRGGDQSSRKHTVGFRNSLTRSFPCGLVGRRRYARLGPFSHMIASFSCTTNVAKSMAIRGYRLVTVPNGTGNRLSIDEIEVMHVRPNLDSDFYQTP